MQQLVELQMQGVEWREAYEKAFPISLDDLTDAVTRHVAALSRGALVNVASFDVRDLPVERNFAVRELAPVEVARELGEVSLAIFDDESLGSAAAVAFFRRALELDADDARAQAGLALARAQQGRLDSAAAEIARAREEQPGDVWIALAQGQLHKLLASRSGADSADAAAHRQQAREAFQRATRLAPRHPSGWAGIGWSHLEDDDPTPGIEALTRAQATGAWDADVCLDLGRLYDRAGDTPRARELWQQVARLGDERHAEEARQLLEEAGKPPS
jgi:FimV-like protein